MKTVRMQCLKCGFLDEGKNTFLDRKELRSKIKDRMIICPECGNNKRFDYWNLKDDGKRLAN